MNKINKLTKEINITKIERNIYLLSSILLISTIIINILNLFYYPYLLNGLILEINILILTILYLIYIKKRKQIFKLEDKLLEQKIKYIIKSRNYIK